MSSRTRWIRLLFRILGIGLFIIILTRVDLGKIALTYKSIHPALGITAVILLFLLVLIKAKRWRDIVSWQGREISIARAFRIYGASLFLGVVTPGHAGDFAKSIYLSNIGFSAGKALMSSFADRLLDIIALGLVCFACLFAVPGIFENQLLVSILILAIALAIVVGFFAKREILARAIRFFLRAFPSERMRGNLDRAVTEGLGEFSVIKGRRIIALSMLTLCAWIVHYSYFLVMARALRLGASPALVFIAVSVAIVVSLVPVSVSGLGTRELALVLVFGRFGFGREEALTFAFSFILSYLILGTAGFGMYLANPFGGRADGMASDKVEEVNKDARETS